MPRLFTKEDADFEVSISTHTIVKFILFVLGAFLLMGMIRASVHALTLIGVAFFLSLALNAPVRWLAVHLPGKRRGNRNLATTISIVVILAALAGFLMAIVPPLVKQTTSFVQALPQLVDDTRSGTGPIGSFVHRYNLESQVDKLSSQLSGRLDNIGGSALSTVSAIGSSVFAMLTVLVLTVMMLTEGPRWRVLFEQLIPASQRAHVSRLGNDMNRVVQGYVNGQVLLAAIAAVIITPVLFLAGVSYPIALMVIVFICGLIPMVGHTIGAAIVTTVALFHTLTAAMIVLCFYIAYQQIENYFVQPRIQANSTNMSPLLVFMAVLLGAGFSGLLGALVAIPIMGCVRILLLDYLERRDIISKKEMKSEITASKSS
jgi:predicted PurR-regulated permease PerM